MDRGGSPEPARAPQGHVKLPLQTLLPWLTPPVTVPAAVPVVVMVLFV